MLSRKQQHKLIWKMPVVGRICSCISLTLLIVLFNVNMGVAAAVSTDDVDYTQIQEVIDDIMDSKKSINFRDYVDRLMKGEEGFSLSSIGNQLIQTVKSNIKGHIDTFARLITIALVAAIFTNLSTAFKNNQVAETGYYITYLLLFSLLISSFIEASVIAASTIGQILDFMKALVPAYCISVGFCTGSATSMVYYQAALGIITLADIILVNIVIPMINFYMVIMLANNLSKEDMLSKLAALLETIIRWLLKSLLAVVVGFQTVQGLIIPVADRLKRSTLFKASEAIPGVGNAIGGVTQTILGAGVLLKNSIGVAGLVVIVAICIIPIIKLVIISVVFRCGGASLQPVSDNRIIECISASSKSAEMLLHSVLVGAILFILSITIVAVTTSGKI